MSFVTTADAIDASRREWSYKSLAASELRKAASAPMTTEYDIFLSHSYEDAEVIAGVRILLQREGFSVYVDWIEDADADRSNVTPATADVLRRRMRHCRHLIYACSWASSNSKWMPWELGYFDGFRQGHVGILPIVRSRGERFLGQEYLGLYPLYQYIEFEGLGRRLGEDVDATTARLLTRIVQS